MKLGDHVKLGNEIKDCLDCLSEIKKKSSQIKEPKSLTQPSKAIILVNNLREALNRHLVSKHPEAASFVYFGPERSILVKVEGSSKEVLCPIPKKELEKKRKGVKSEKKINSTD